MQEAKFITQLIFMMKLTQYLVLVWACADVPGHTQLKWLIKFVDFMHV